MNLIKKQDASGTAEKEKSAGIHRVRDWLEAKLPDEEKDEDLGGTAPPGKETTVIVNQLECKEPGCPPVEIVMTLLRAKPAPKLMFKIFKAAAEATQEEVEAALQTALAGEKAGNGEASHEHAHQEKTAKTEHGHEHDGDCCGHDHGHDEEKDHAHGHGHGHAHEEKHHGHDHDSHEHGHEHDGECCGHDHGHDEKKDHAHGHGHGHAHEEKHHEHHDHHS